VSEQAPMLNDVEIAGALVERPENERLPAEEVSLDMSNAVQTPRSIVENKVIPTDQSGGGDEVLMNEAEKWVDEGFKDRAELSDSVDLISYCDYYDDFGMFVV
jgi:hypothetical protein